MPSPLPMAPLLALLLVLCAGAARADDHRYKEGEEVTLWVNKVGPYSNPQESYSYYSLPFCRPEGAKPVRHMHDGLGAVLEGNDMRDSGVHIRFREDMPATTLCEVSMSKRAAHIFAAAVRNNYWYQMYVDELPMWGFVGQLVPDEQAGAGAAADRAFLYTHKSLSVAYNGDRVIQVNLTSENPVPITADGADVPMTFSVTWKETGVKFEDRFDRYLDETFFEHQIHWFSVVNSVMMVIALLGVVVVILMRTLRNDYVRFATDDEEMELERVIDESGWKQVHGDVFRAPPRLALFAALVGTGSQLAVLVLAVVLLAIAGSLYVERGAVLSTFFGVYALTCLVAGYASGSVYKRYGGKKWKRTMMLTAVAFPGASFGIAFVLNFVAIGYQVLATMSVGTMASMAGIWALVALPLTVLGTVAGRKSARRGDFPCRVNTIKRPVPDGPWYTQRAVLVLACGVLPFGAIFIELYYVFSAVFSYKFYYVYGFMLLVYLILTIVVACTTIVGTYCQLNAEDWRWPWTAFYSGASTSLYVVLYSVYYFFTKTRMSGLFQTAYFFGFTSICALGLGLLCGAVAFVASSLFVRKIYSYIKSD